MGSCCWVNLSNYGKHLAFVAVYIGLPTAGLFLPSPAGRVVNRQDGAINDRLTGEMQVEASTVRRWCGHYQVMTVMDASDEGKLATGGNLRGLNPIQMITHKARIARLRSTFHRWQYSTCECRCSRRFPCWSGLGRGRRVRWSCRIRERSKRSRRFPCWSGLGRGRRVRWGCRIRERSKRSRRFPCWSGLGRGRRVRWGCRSGSEAGVAVGSGSSVSAASGVEVGKTGAAVSGGTVAAGLDMTVDSGVWVVHARPINISSNERMGAVRIRTAEPPSGCEKCVPRYWPVLLASENFRLGGCSRVRLWFPKLKPT